jgi:hypothetical protein
MGWDYLLGDMFGVDHATVAVDGMGLPGLVMPSSEGTDITLLGARGPI